MVHKKVNRVGERGRVELGSGKVNRVGERQGGAG